MKYLILLFIFLSVSVFAQLDSLDRVELNNGRTLSGKVMKVTSGTVEFRETMTNLIYEYQKSEIKNLRLSNGTVLTFSTQSDQGNVTGSVQNPNPPAQTTATSPGTAPAQQQNESQDGLSTTALLLLGASGVIVLLLLGAAIF